MKKLFATWVMIFAGVLLTGCSSEPELAADDPANCEQMKDFPEAYEECLEALGR